MPAPALWPGRGAAVHSQPSPRLPAGVGRVVSAGRAKPWVLHDLVVQLSWVLLEAPVGLLTEGIAWAAQVGSSSRGAVTLCLQPALPAAPTPEAPSPGTHTHPLLPVWQLCTQMRCPSYLQLHFMALLVKSLSATSKLGLITTCGQGATLPHGAACMA